MSSTGDEIKIHISIVSLVLIFGERRERDREIRENSPQILEAIPGHGF